MSKQVMYCYPAILQKMKEGYGVYFPDFKGCVSAGKDVVDAIESGREALAFHIDAMLKDKETIPDPSDYAKLDKNEGDIIVLVDFNINVYRFKNKNKSVTRAVTLPQSLNELAKANDINVSGVLQEALKEILNIKED